MYLFAQLTEQDVRRMIRHECGHAVVGRALGFPPGGIVLKADSAGADSEHHLSFREMKDAISFIEKRLQVLYAGSVAESLDANGKCQLAMCRRLLETTAANDMATIRELSRVLVGMADPDLDKTALGRNWRKMTVACRMKPLR